jgi:phosphocarrier protein
MIVRLANKHPKTELRVRKDDEEVNGKSIMGLMMLAAGNGSKLTFTASGTETGKVLDELEALFARKFDEA